MAAGLYNRSRARICRELISQGPHQLHLAIEIARVCCFLSLMQGTVTGQAEILGTRLDGLVVSLFLLC